MANPPPDDNVIIEKELEKLVDPVTIVIHETPAKNDTLEAIKPMIDEIGEKYEKVTVKYVIEEGDPNDQIRHLVDHFPAFVILDKDENDHGIRFYGCPSGSVFRSFISTLVMFSTGSHEVEDETVKEIEGLKETDIQVLVTPNAPAIMDTMDVAQKVAYLSKNVKTCILDLIQFPDIAEQYRVLGIPKTIVNETQHYTGPYTMKEGLDILIKNISDAEE